MDRHDPLHPHQDRSTFRPVARPIAHGWHWLNAGFKYFKSNPAGWVASISIFLLMSLLLGMLPIIGNVAGSLLSPVLIGGLMLGCYQQAQGQSFTPKIVFAGFEKHAGPLLSIGAIYLILLVASFFVWTVAFLSLGLIDLETAQRLQTETAVAEFMRDNPRAVAIGFLLLMAVVLPVFMGLWLSPALVAIGGLKPWRAYKLSIVAGLKNLLPMLWLNVVLIAIAMAVIAPLLLLTQLLPWLSIISMALVFVFATVVLCTVMASSYVMAADIFPELRPSDEQAPIVSQAEF